MTDPSCITQFEGTVRREHMAGTNEDATCLVLPDGTTYRLRRRGGHPQFDPEIDEMVGKQLSITGQVLPDGVLLAMGWTELS